MRATAFTLVELMIVVAIIAVLAAIAIPAFASFQYRAKRAEVFPNSAALEDSAFALAVDLDAGAVQVSVGPPLHPRDYDDLDKEVVPWGVPASDDWARVGWVPDGDVRCTYSFNATSGPMGTFAQGQGACDVDGDRMMYLHTGARWLDGTAAVSRECKALTAGPAGSCNMNDPGCTECF